MSQTELQQQIVELAEAGGALPTEEALRVVATMVGRLDPADECYELNVAALMRVGATIWSLAGGGR